MDDVNLTDLALLKEDLSLRGYDQNEVEELLNLPVFIIPGSIVSENNPKPEQKLTPHQVMISKDLKKQGIPCEIVLQKGVPRVYVEERHAHVDLGTIVVNLMAAYQLGTFANIAQILDFLLNLIQAKFSRGRTEQLMPNVPLKLEFHNGNKVVSLDTTVPADQIKDYLQSKKFNKLVIDTLAISQDEEN
jgi:hypothetical protein